MSDVIEPPLPLAIPEQPNPPPRPKRTAEMRARSVLKNVMEWLEGEGTEEEVLEDLVDAIGTAWRGGDGYEIASILDRKGWEPDSALVEILESADGYTEHQAAVLAWIEVNGIRPKFMVGDVVSYRGEHGKIVGIQPGRAEYVVQTASYLKVHPEQETRGGGYVVPYEDAKEVQ